MFTLLERKEADEPAPAAGGLPAPAIELVGVGRSFGSIPALQRVNLRVRPGENVAILGPSGAGKTTLLRLANTSLLPSYGHAHILGEDPRRLGRAALRRLRSRIGTVYQQLHLVPQASAIENVLMGRLGRRSALSVALGPLRRSDREEVAQVLAQVGLVDKIDQRVDRLSGGEQQRVAVARVLYQAPDLVVADEPFSSVDPERCHSVLRLLLAVARGRTLILSTHHLEPVLPHLPRIVGLRGGRILFDKPRAQVTPGDLATLYQPEGATRSPEPRQVVPASEGALQGAEVRVGASTTPGEHLLPGAAASFARMNRGMQVRLAVKGTNAILDDLAAGRVELAFVGARSAHPALHFEDFAEDEIILVAAPQFGGLPLPLTALLAARLPRVDREPGSATRAIVEAQLAEMGVTLDPASSVFEAGSVAALVSAVEQGMGVGFASRRSVASALAGGRIREVPIEAVKVPRRFFVAWRHGHTLSDGARRFLECARRSAAEIR